MNLRKIYNSRTGQEEIYDCPDTAHWADWHDADAARAHGTLIAEKRKDGWHNRCPDGILYADVCTEDQRYSGMKPIGIAT